MSSIGSSPDPLTADNSPVHQTPPRSTRRAYRSGSNHLSKPLGNVKLQNFVLATPSIGSRYSSPTKSIARSENINISPWTIRVTVEAEHENEEEKGAQRIMSMSPSKSPSKSRTTTTTIPLRDGDEITTSKGRKRKSLTPAKRKGTPRPRRIVNAEEVDVETDVWASLISPTRVSPSTEKRGSGPLERSIEMAADLEQMPSSPSPQKRRPGRPRKSLTTNPAKAEQPMPSSSPQRKAPGRPRKIIPVAVEPEREATFDPAKSVSPRDTGTEPASKRVGVMASPSRRSAIPSPKGLIAGARGNSQSREEGMMRPALSANHRQSMRFDSPEKRIAYDNDTSWFRRSQGAGSTKQVTQNQGKVEQPPLIDPTDEHDDFDSILESENFTMMSLSNVHSAQQISSLTRQLPRQNTSAAKATRETSQNSDPEHNIIENNFDEPLFSAADSANTMLSGFGLDTIRELRAGVRLGEELAKRQVLAKQAAAAIDEYRQSKSASNLLSRRDKMPTPESLDQRESAPAHRSDPVEYPKLPDEHLPSPEQSDDGPLQVEGGDPMSWRLDTPGKTRLAQKSDTKDNSKMSWKLDTPGKTRLQTLRKTNARPELHRKPFTADEQLRLESEASHPPIGDEDDAEDLDQIASFAVDNDDNDSNDKQRTLDRTDVVSISSNEQDDDEDEDDENYNEEHTRPPRDEETFDIWQSEAQLSLLPNYASPGYPNLPEAKAAEVEKDLYMPRRAKLPSAWRRQSDTPVIYSDEPELPPSEAEHVFHVLGKRTRAPVISTANKRTKYSDTDFSVLSEFQGAAKAAMPSSERSPMLRRSSPARSAMAGTSPARPGTSFSTRKVRFMSEDGESEMFPTTPVQDDGASEVDDEDEDGLDDDNTFTTQSASSIKKLVIDRISPSRRGSIFGGLLPSWLSKDTPERSQQPHVTSGFYAGSDDELEAKVNEHEDKGTETQHKTVRDGEAIVIAEPALELENLSQPDTPPQVQSIEIDLESYTPRPAPAAYSPQSELPWHLPFTREHYALLQKICLRAKKKPELYLGGVDSIDTWNMLGCKIEAKGWKKTISESDIAIAKAFLQCIPEESEDRVRGDKGRSKENESTKTAIGHVEVLKRIFSLWAGEVQRGETYLERGATPGLFSRDHVSGRQKVLAKATAKKVALLPGLRLGGP